MSKSVVLLSGGIDSSTCMALACKESDVVLPVHISYGQQTDKLEYDRAKKQRKHLASQYPLAKVKEMELIPARDVFQAFSEGVTEEGKEFSGMVEDDGRSSGYVPMRNLLLIGIGSAIADARGYDSVWHGAQAGDVADYPDCRSGFLNTMRSAVNRSLPDEESLKLHRPLVHLSKEEVIENAQKYNVDLAMTYSCYKATSVENPEPCGECPACKEREEAFESAGIDDPIEEEQ